MINIKNKAECSGCASCANICPFKCISMEEDKEGFLYPKVNIEQCKECGLCENVCPILNRQVSINKQIPHTFACINNNEEERLCSSSGGVFSLLAKCIIEQNGVVYGVGMTEDCYSAKFIRVDNTKQLYLLRGSKYLQAKTGNTYIKVKSDLDKGLLVLFSGTGCQINGLRLYLKRDYENLLCVDVICHGTPSPALWRKYVQFYEKKYGKLHSVNFRCKDNGWGDFGMKEDSLYISKDIDPYMQMFLKNYSLRPSCYECTAKEIKMSDMTIADFWGIENIVPEMDDHKGTSLVLIRTEKGGRFFEQIREKMQIKEVSYNDGVKENSAEYKSVDRPVQRDAFFDDMNALPFDELKKKYAHVSWTNKCKINLKKIIKNTLLRKYVRGGVKRSDEYGILFRFK